MVSEKTWRLESTLQLGLRLFLCYAVGALLATTARQLLGDRAVEDSLLNMILATLAFQGAGLVLVALFLREHQVGWAEAFGFKTDPAWAVLLGIAVAVIAVPIAWYLQSAGVELLTRWHFVVSGQDAVRLLWEAQALWKQAYLGLFAVVVAPVAEEILFRGILYPFLKQHGHPQLALWGTAILFAGVHVNLGVVLPLVFLAVVLALLYEWTDNLLACIVVHSLFNAANFVMLFALKNSGQLPGN